MFSSFTNAVGTYSRSGVGNASRVEKQYYWYRPGDPDVSSSSREAQWLAEISRKPAPYPGDRHSAYPYRRSGWKCSQTRGSFSADTYQWFGLSNSYVEDYYITDLVGDDELNMDGYELQSYSESLTKALNSVNQNKLGGGENIGQARQTIDLFTGAVHSVAKLLLAAKRGDFWSFVHALNPGGHDIKQTQKNIANLWLAWIYGIKPLLSDVYNLLDLLKENMAVDHLVKGYGSAKDSKTVDYDHFWANGANYLNAHGERMDSSKTKLTFKIDNPMLYLLNSAGLINPVSIAWELVPFSFVVDWFIPVGSVLQALSAQCGLSYVGGYTTTLSSSRCVMTVPEREYNNHVNKIERWSHAEKISESYNMVRNIHVNVPLPELYADFTPYSTTRGLNALALIRQLR